MYTKMSLSLSHKDFEDLHMSVDRVRSHTKKIYVDRQAIVNLLIDYSKLIQELETFHYIFDSAED